jgi:UMF1 family MFS transporter
MTTAPPAVSMTGGAPAGRLGQVSWAFFDWANQPFFTLITTFIFAPYFTAFVVGDPTEGQVLWGYVQAAAGASIALLSPVLGSIADASGRRKPWILVFQVISIIACWMLWYALPGAPDGIVGILVAVTIATVAAEFSIVFSNAMLPSLTSEGRIGRLSGYSWALGYAGGLVTLFFVLLAFSLPETPMFGLDRASHEHDRIVGPLSAVWMAVFIIPLFLFTPDAPASGIGAVQAVRDGLKRIAGTLRHLRDYKMIGLFLLARMFYYDGLTAVFAFGGIYAQGVFGWDSSRLGIFGIVLVIFAMAGAAAGGWLDDRMGSKPTILVAIGGMLIATLGVVSVSATGETGQFQVLFALTVSGPTEGSALLSTPAELVFLVFGIMLGIFGGPMQAASRTLLARLAPADMIGEFYGLYALSGKATAFLAPLVVAIVTSTTDSQRAGISTLIAFFIIGGLLLLPVARPSR